MRTVYTSDPHYGHANIIGFSRRPFADVADMDQALFRATWAALPEGTRLVNCGDVAWDMKKVVERLGPLPNAADNVLVCGNHDRIKSRSDTRPFYAWFGRIVGLRDTWRTHAEVVWDELDGRPVRVLCSHEPQLDLRGAAYNVYGHVHNNVAPPWNEFNQGYAWLLESPRHLNACVEMTEYRPRPLEWLVRRQAELIALRAFAAELKAQDAGP